MKNGARLRARSCEGRLHGSGIPGLIPWVSTAASAAAFSVHPGLRVLSASLLWNLSDLGWLEVTRERSSRTPESQARGCTGGDFIGVTEAWGLPRTTALCCDQGCRFLGKGALLCWPVLSPQDGTTGRRWRSGEDTASSFSPSQLCTYRASTQTLCPAVPSVPPSFYSYFPGLFLCPGRTPWPWTAVQPLAPALRRTSPFGGYICGSSNCLHILPRPSLRPGSSLLQISS